MAETTLPSFAPGTLDARIDDPALAAAVAAVLLRAAEERWAERLQERDTTLWSSDPAVQEKIAEPPRLARPAGRLRGSDRGPRGVRGGVRDADLTTAIVAGMGGSSLAPEVIATAFGDLEDWLSIRVLDSTDPAAVAAAWEGLHPLATLFIVATKSGTTTETLAFQADAWERIHEALREAHHRFDRRASSWSPSPTRAEVPGRRSPITRHPRGLPQPRDGRGPVFRPQYVGLVPASLAASTSTRSSPTPLAMRAACHATDPLANPGAASA